MVRPVPRPPAHLTDGDFVATGDEFLSHLVALCELKPDDRVLDVGCGDGRLARPLAGFLSIDGAYAGLDPDPDGIAWCAHRYRHLPHFHFVAADGGHRSPFPFDDGAFDVAALISVLSHLTEEETLHELGQVRRVLAPGGRMLATARVVPEREEWLLDTLRAAGLDLVDLHPGTWSGRDEGLSDDDLVVARA